MEGEANGVPQWIACVGLAALAVWRLQPERWQVANSVAFASNWLAVTHIPRLDTSPDVLSRPNFLTPAGYAFAIWGVIYSMEFLMVAWQVVQTPKYATQERRALLERFSPWWCSANACQVAWCFTFTSRFDSPYLLWVSAVCLSGIALSLSRAHLILLRAKGTQENILLYVPVTLHFGWATAASLVNWNGFIARCTDSAAVRLAAVLLSVGLASAIGAKIALERRSALYAATVTWALVAVGIQSRRSIPLAEVLGIKQALVLGATEIGCGVLVLTIGLMSRLTPSLLVPLGKQPTGRRP